MVGMQNQTLVEHRCCLRIWLITVHHVQEIGSMAEVGAGQNRPLIVANTLPGRNYGRHGGGKTQRFVHVGLK